MARARDGSNEVQRLRTHSGAAVAALTVGSPATRVLAPTIPAPRTRNDLRRTKRGSVRHQSERGWRQATAIRSAAGAGVPTSGAGPGDLKSNSGVCEGALGVARSIDLVFFPRNGVVAQTKRHPENQGRFRRTSSIPASLWTRSPTRWCATEHAPGTVACIGARRDPRVLSHTVSPAPPGCAPPPAPVRGVGTRIRRRTARAALHRPRATRQARGALRRACGHSARPSAAGWARRAMRGCGRFGLRRPPVEMCWCHSGSP